MRRVIIESPYAGNIEQNKLYLRRAILDCIRRNETPYASHQMLTEALADSDEDERKLGISAGFGWREAAHATVVYKDYGVSRGMQFGIDHAKHMAQFVAHTIEEREIGQNPRVCDECGADPGNAADCLCVSCGHELWR